MIKSWANAIPEYRAAVHAALEAGPAGEIQGAEPVKAIARQLPRTIDAWPMQLTLLTCAYRLSPSIEMSSVLRASAEAALGYQLAAMNKRIPDISNVDLMKLQVLMQAASTALAAQHEPVRSPLHMPRGL